MSWKVWAWTALFVAMSPVMAAAAEVGLITGNEKGTYYQVGLNIQALAKPHGITLTVVPSKGSIENIYAVYRQPGPQLGIVQADVLAFITRVQSDPVLRDIARKTQMVFPLYNEEIHLLARRGIRDFDDLADRRVAIGSEGSGTYLTARLLFNVSEVTPRELVPIDTDEALAELKAGRIDAMLYVSGVPVTLLREGVTADDNLTLLPITNKSITKFYPTVDIPANTYPWQEADVPTVAVKSVLVSFGFKHRDCDNVGRVAKVIADNMDWLAKNGHPKWKTVDLGYQLKGWEQYDCVRRYLGQTVVRAGGPLGRRAELEPVMDAINQILGD